MTTPPSPIRVLLVDDDPAFLETLSAAAAERNIAIVGTARSGEEALARVDDLQPDVVVLDVLMPGMGGVEAARLCRERHPSCRVILISGSILQHSHRCPHASRKTSVVRFAGHAAGGHETPQFATYRARIGLRGGPGSEYSGGAQQT